jgi:hypothetical protein
MHIYEVTDPAFREYGRIVKGIDFTELISALEKTPCPEDSTIYVPGDPELEKLPVYREISVHEYGEMPIQIGYCNGHNHKLNALEYHRSSEINLGTQEFYLILGRQADVTDEMTYETSNCVAFHVPAHLPVEVFATSLHYAPLSVGDQGFQVMVVLPKGTNTALKEKHEGGEDGHLTAVNKWLIGHPEGGLAEGSPLGLIGENLSI